MYDSDIIQAFTNSVRGISDVTHVSVILNASGDRITNVHVVTASSPGTWKGLARDIESLAIARYHMTNFDWRVVSIVGATRYFDQPATSWQQRRVRMHALECAVRMGAQPTDEVLVNAKNFEQYINGEETK